MRRANDSPIQRALSYDGFLAFVVCESMSQEYAHDDVLGKERQVGSTISYTKRGLTDQTFHAGTLHGLMAGADWETTGRIASLMGAIKIETAGTQNHSVDAESFARRFREQFGFEPGL